MDKLNSALKSLYCVEILNAIGLDEYLNECSKYQYYCSYSDKYHTCTRMYDVPDNVVIELHSKYVLGN